MHEASPPATLADITPQVPLSELVTALDTAVRAVLPAEGAEERSIRSVRILEPAPAGVEWAAAPPADLLLPVVMGEDAVATWLRRIERTDPPSLPRALAVREPEAGDGLRAAARDTGVTLVVLDAEARWDRVFAVVLRRLEKPARHGSGSPDGTADAPRDLTELAVVIAEGTGGMVSIERADSRLLAFSPSDGTADALRARAILGQQAPADSMRLLEERGVLTAIRRGREVVGVSEDRRLGMRPRLVTGIRSPSGQFLGSIWVQQGEGPFQPHANAVMQGGAVAAAQMLQRDRQALTVEERALNAVFGEHDDLDSAAAAALVGLPQHGDAIVLGLAVLDPDAEAAREAMWRISKVLRLHVSAFSSRSLFLRRGARAYALLPDSPSWRRTQDWAEQLPSRFSALAGMRGRSLQVALVGPVSGLDHAPAARREADRLLDATREGDPPVISLARSRTRVLLREALDLVGGRPELRDPRIDALQEHDDTRGTELLPSLTALAEAGFNAREAARMLQVHPNTLRYRIERAQGIIGLDLTRSEDRLHLSLQLAARQAAGARRVTAGRTGAPRC